jgi:uncharacterized membrane protein
MPTQVVAIAYDDENTARRAERYLRQASDDNEVALDEVAVVERAESGDVTVTIEAGEVSQRLGGGATGALIGGIVGVLVGPVGAVVGFVAGGAIGAHEAGHQGAVDDDFLRDVGDAITPGSSAIVLAGEIEELTWLSGNAPDDLRGRMINTTLSDEQVARLREIGQSATS